MKMSSNKSDYFIWECVLVFLLFLIVVADVGELFAAGPGDQAQAVEQLTAWDWFQGLEKDKRAETAAFIAAPGILAILATMLFMTTLRRMYEWSDKVCLPVSLVMAAGFGVLCTALMMGFINQSLQYQVYGEMALYAAGGLTPIVNFIIFKLLTLFLLAVFVVSDYVPEKTPFYWVARPAQILAKGLYRMLTGKGYIGVKNEEGEVIAEEEKDSNIITQIMKTKFVDFDPTAPVVGRDDEKTPRNQVKK